MSRAATHRLSLGGARVDLQTEDDVVGAVRSALAAPSARPLFVASANLDHVTWFGRGSGMSGAFDEQQDADWLVLLDGMPLVWMSRRLTGRRPPLLAGSDLLPRLFPALEQVQARIAVVGGRTDMHDALRRRLAVEHPGIQVPLTLAPSRAELTDPRRCTALADQVRASGAEVLIVALGKPGQERFLLEHGTRCGARVSVAFGAAADFYAGTEKRVPEVWRGSGVEWLYRLGREPRRLGRRYLVQGPAAVAQLLRRSGPWQGPHAGGPSADAPVPPRSWR